jgi:hypothetical protein
MGRSGFLDFHPCFFERLKARLSARLRRAGCLFLNLGSLRHD